jgi:membrane-associated phospholipid phosphatase
MTTLTMRSLHLAVNNVLAPKGLNTSIYLSINNFSRHTFWAHGFMRAYALWLGAVLLVAVFLAAYAVIWVRRDHRAAALMGLSGIATFVALGLNQLVGHAFKELRPYVTLHHVLVLVPRANDYAFPSDHAVIAGAMMASVLLVGRRIAPHTSQTSTTIANGRALLALGIVNAIFGLLLCFARVYVGAHYPGDVVAGLLLGALAVVLVSLLRPLAYRVADLAERTPFSVLVRRPPA